MTKNEKDGNEDKLHPTLSEVYLGVWRVVYSHGPTVTIPGRHTIEQCKKGYQYARTYLWPFFRDVWRVLGTGLFGLYFLHHFWWGIESALLLYLLSRLLEEIERAYLNGKPDTWAIGSTLLIRLFCVAGVAFVKWFDDGYSPVMRTRVKLHFQKVVMQTHLRLDLPTYSDSTNRIQVQASQTWYIFTDIMGIVTVAFSALSHLALIVDLARGEQGGLFFAILCVAKPIFSATFTRDLWSTNFILYAVNPYYLRSVALNSLATDTSYKQEVLSGALEEYIEDEYQKTQDALGEIPDEFPSALFSANRSPTINILEGILGDLPLIYYAINSLIFPGKISVTSLAMFQQTASSIRDTFDRINRQKSSLNENLHHVEALYDGMSIKNTIPDGLLPYPPSGEKDVVKRGMAVSARNVSFKYPGSSETRIALKDVSFDIPASSLVVIVGANGSGKSSLVKLLSNLHHPTSGTILVDGKPSTDYCSQDLRRATALLTQDHLLFPFTVAENIAVGDPDAVDSPDKAERVLAAAKLGGAMAAINKLDHGIEEMTRRAESVYASQYPMPPGPLKDIMDKVEKYTDFSGGESQRLVASRTFMRISSGRMRLVVADEPTSAMDPEGEFELFEALRKVQEGTTMIFITHRFGHLTKHADLILCMKEGELVESGTHRELIAKEGEYHKLYNIQASAFREVRVLSYFRLDWRADVIGQDPGPSTSSSSEAGETAEERVKL